MLDSKMVGRRSEPCLNEVEKGAILRFAEALSHTDSVCIDEMAAQAAGYRSLLVPPTFPLTFQSIDIRTLLRLNNHSVVPADQSFEYFRPICAGDRVFVVATVVEVTQRPGASSPVDVVVVEDEGRDEEGNLLYRGRKTLIVRPGPREE